MAPDRIELHNMCKRENESFKEYAQRWIDLAAKVVPPDRVRNDNNDNGHTSSILQ